MSREIVANAQNSTADSSGTYKDRRGFRIGRLTFPLLPLPTLNLWQIVLRTASVFSNAPPLAPSPTPTPTPTRVKIANRLSDSEENLPPLLFW